MQTIKLKHPHIKGTWLKSKPNQKNTLVIETNLSMPDRKEGFMDGRFSDLLNYLARETRPYWSSLMDIEIRNPRPYVFAGASKRIH